MSQADACIEHDTSTQPQPDGSYDIALLRRYFRNGDKEAMSELFNRNADALYRVACGFLGNSTDAEDVVQATFLQVIQKGERITDSNSNLRGWMMSIVIGNCHKRFRDERKWQPIALVAEDSVCFSDEQNEMISAALRSVQGLPERYRLPVWLHYLEGYTFKEVASALSLSENTARVQAHRGIEQIRKSLLAAGFSAVVVPALLSTTVLPAAPATLGPTFAKLLTSSAVKGAALGAAKIRVATIAAVALAGMLSVAAVVRVADRGNETKGDGDSKITRVPTPEDTDAEDARYFEKVLAADKAAREERIANARKLRELNTAMHKQEEAAMALSSTTVIIDEDTLEVSEPNSIESALALDHPVRDAYEISPDDFKIEQHERWSINTSDFKFDRPRYITSRDRVGHERTWFTVKFEITNPTSKSQRIVPMFTAQAGFERPEGSDDWPDNPALRNFVPSGPALSAIGALLPERVIAESILSAPEQGPNTPLENLIDLGHMKLNPMNNSTAFAGLNENGGANFEPGQTRTGVALWPDFPNEFTVLKIVVHGLTNSHRYPQADITKGFGTASAEPNPGENMRRVLVLTFARKSDEFSIHRSELKNIDKRWEYLWCWDHDISIPLPNSADEPQIKVLTLQTPAGGQKLAWAVPFVLTNSTRYHEEIAFNRISFACPLEVTVAGAAMKIEAKVIDDGESTIYKAQLLTALGLDSPKDRWAIENTSDRQTRTERRALKLTPGGKLAPLWAAFDSNDIDFDDARTQIESAPGFNRRLNDGEFESLKNQIAAALPAAVEAARKHKTVIAYVDCKSGLSSGVYRISRSYRLPGVVDDKSLKAWEDADR